MLIPISVYGVGFLFFIVVTTERIGKWNNKKKRKQSIKHALNALQTLVDVLTHKSRKRNTAGRQSWKTVLMGKGWMVYSQSDNQMSNTP